MKQNIYDNDIFYQAYLDLRLNSTGLNDVLEIPAFRSLLPENLTGMRILDLGCGFGQACSRYASQGAAKVIGVDISKKMISRAKQIYRHENIEYVCLPIEDIGFPREEFDLVLSSLAFHYIADLKNVLERILYCLKNNGFLIFSQEHPVATAKQIPDGWCKNENGEKMHWILDDYNDEGIRKQNWLIKDVIKYHRTMSTIMNTLIGCGFKIVKVLEPTPIKEAEIINKDLKNERRRPPFLMIKAQKGQSSTHSCRRERV
ncbi:class I SAM-dependent methyltransferase [Sporomusa acidovorans]|uniref:Ubiquinone biosynthesis O-methyltransferase, mitochondrial n=1 Tax=Sporomusa acidovorans (strain ATCC 49682 / DSM 3132 / Mol) TaxID=1123286 RepID=A0ABZ3IZ52_SPOA4|nr:class I SAM-dependent methyltransferase [Sporomusa acidovorans]OZC18314.1 aklanonic acid methyltransferase DauC [Sporomusa acidovorans DSM 3132]SDF20279.1 Methyltransferase domain-containing protein [Sporomusa acidovorans]